MGKLNLGLLIPAMLQLSSLIIVLLILISPAPFNHSSISLLRIEPFNNTNSSSVGDSAANSKTRQSSTVYSMSLNTSNTTSAPVPISTSNSSDAQTSVPIASITTDAPKSASITAAPTPGQASNARPTDMVSEAVQESNENVKAASTNSSASNIVHRREDMTKRPFGVLNSTQPYIQPSSLSKIRVILGPLGSCTIDADGNRRCSKALLLPAFNTVSLAADQIGEYDLRSLPSTIKAIPIILLVVLVIFIFSFALALPPLLAAFFPAKFGFLMQAGPRERALRRAQKCVLWAIMCSWVLLAASGISLRVTFSSARTAFNASNIERSLPLTSTKDATYSDVGLQAELGNAFTLTWATLGLLAVHMLMERRRMKRAEAVAQARADVEAQWGRNVLEAGQSLVKNASGPSPAFQSPPSADKEAQNIVMHNLPKASTSASSIGSGSAANHYWISSSNAHTPSSGAQHHYVHGYGFGQAPSVVHTQEREYLCDSPVQMRRAHSPPPFERYMKSRQERGWEISRGANRGVTCSPAPTESAYEHHMRSVEDLDLVDSALASEGHGFGKSDWKDHQCGASSSSHSHANGRPVHRKASFESCQSNSHSISRGISPAPSYWSQAHQTSTFLGASSSAEMEKAREEAKEARARVEWLERELRERERKNEEWKEEMKRAERIEMIKRRQRGGLGYRT
ncbi:hypothetical protein IE81DRAFT_158565 [Ceraceosorus guamensis]|uniref:Uncharacterized protein n=1 Tax=Ceraceosorus guamensis TaxID=1522189 RepID=A0A316VWC8_9BASI|nr:hypothetical protein IE81DRAFT_158565 [Ceraceosorus guamensis]PWN41752.1 hypothetical protein IE81DRAFT_158565 [Ceraceosorus guamensis]